MTYMNTPTVMPFTQGIKKNNDKKIDRIHEN